MADKSYEVVELLISAQQVKTVLKVYSLQQVQTGGASTSQPVTSPAPADKVFVSKTSKEMQMIRQSVEQAPGIREDRVSSLKKAIKTGTYNLSGEEIAEKMISRSLVDNLL